MSFVTVHISRFVDGVELALEIKRDRIIVQRLLTPDEAESIGVELIETARKAREKN